MNKVATIKYQGNDYATVPVRLKEFRQNNPRASISTVAMPQPDGSMIIQAKIVADKADESSADATGTARYSEKEMQVRKAFEKLETIATGRALSLLGYLNNGEIAGSEELDEFYAYRTEKYEEDIKTATSVDELMQIFRKMNAEDQKLYTEALSERKKELLNATAK